MERYKDKDGKWAWKYNDEVVVRPSEKKEEQKPVKKVKKK